MKMKYFSKVILSIPVITLMAALSGCTGMTCKNHGCSDRELASNTEYSLTDEEELDRMNENKAGMRRAHYREDTNQQ